jgi:mycothiol synthase
MSEIPFTIRPLDTSSNADWEALAGLTNAVNPDSETTATELQEEERERDKRCLQAHWLAVGESGETVGMAMYSQNPWIYDPQRFNISVKVSPLYEGQGIGTSLYDHLMNELAVFEPKDLHVDVREDKTRAVRFAESRGFREEMKEWESRLNVRAFDPSPWKAARERPTQSGILLRSYAELADDPDRARKLHALESETFLDIPTTVPLTPVPFETFERVVLQSSSFLSEGFQIAIEETTGKYVGSTALYRKEGDYLETGLTGVLRSHRRRGIALALKLCAIDYARSAGISEIRTGNATTNRPMLAINEALGFVKQPVWIWFLKKLIKESAT